MSYYFTILSPTDTPIFNIAFGTSKGGGDGIARFRFPDTAQYMNQFIIHSSLDIVEEAQWTNGGMYVSSLNSANFLQFSLHNCALFPSLQLTLLLNQVPQAHRHLSPRRSLHLRLPHTKRRALPPSPPTSPTPQLRRRQRPRILVLAGLIRQSSAWLDKLHRGEPDLPTDRGGRAPVHDGGLRKLCQDSDESVL